MNHELTLYGLRREKSMPGRRNDDGPSPSFAARPTTSIQHRMTPVKNAFFRWLAGTDFVQRAIADRADLSAFRKPPTPRIIAGVSAIALSYVIGWPAVGALGALSVYFKEPLLLVVGGPLVYGLSHLVFLLGMYLAGADYTRIFLRWAVRVAVEKHFHAADTPPP